MKSISFDKDTGGNLVWGIRKMMNLPKDLTHMQNIILALTEHGLARWKLIFEGGKDYVVKFDEH
jgi:hypothetical protein